MVSAGRVGIAMLLLGLLLAGCSGVGNPPPQTTTATVVDETTTAEATPESETNTSETTACRVEGPEYDVSAPESVTVLNRTTAERVAVEYEKRYQRARHETIYDVSYYESSLARVEVEDIENGFEVTVKVRVDVETRDGDELSGGYPHTYRVSENRVVREGTTVACWNADNADE